MTFKQIAVAAIKRLAGEMFDYGEFPANWETIHRYEKRFDLQGCGDYWLTHWRANRDKEARRRRAEIYRRNPDNHWHEMPEAEYQTLMHEFRSAA